MSISLSLYKPIISLKIINYENKSNSSRYNKLSCFKYFLSIFFSKVSPKFDTRKVLEIFQVSPSSHS